MTTTEGASPDGGGAGVRISIDHGSCSGTGHCQQSMPEVFVVVNRKAHVRGDVDWPSVDRDRLDYVVESCPWYAITVVNTPEGT